MIEIWLLVVAFYSPGGDYMGQRVYEYQSHYQCYQAVIQISNTKYPMTQTAQAQCMLKPKK